MAKKSDGLRIFCNRCNSITEFDVSVDLSGEWVADCRVCDHIIKWPADVSLAAAIEVHNASNSPSVQVDDNGTPVMSKGQLKQLEDAMRAHGG